MGLRETIISATNTAFKAAGNLKETITYRSISDSPVSPGVPNITNTDYTVQSISETYNEKRHGDNIFGAQVIFYIKYDSLTPTPKEGDKIIDSDSKEWDVLGFTDVANQKILLGVHVSR